MGEIPKKEASPLSDESPKTQSVSALFSSPKSFPLFLCCSLIAAAGGFFFYATTSSAPMQLSDVTRSPLGFDIADLDEEGFLAITTTTSTSTSTTPSPTLSTSSPSMGSAASSHSPSPTTTTTTPPVKMPARHLPRRDRPKQEVDEPFEDPQIYDEDLHRDLVTENAMEQFQSRIDMLEQEIQQLRSVLAQRERMIGQLSKELTESRVLASQVVPVAPAPLEPAPRQVSRTHIVQKGETLSEIAQLYYGNRSSWGKIYRANAEKLPDKNRLPVGALLIIPE